MKQFKECQKNYFKKIKNSRLVMSLLILFLPSLAFAGTKVGEYVGYLCDWLSGEIACAIAVLVAIFSGLEMLEGRLVGKTVIIRCVALGLIIGSAYITRNIFHIGGF